MKTIKILCLVIILLLSKFSFYGQTINYGYDSSPCFGQISSVSASVSCSNEFPCGSQNGSQWQCCRTYTWSLTDSTFGTSSNITQISPGVFNITANSPGVHSYSLGVSSPYTSSTLLPVSNSVGFSMNFSIPIINAIGAITGNSTVCQSQNNVVYSVPLVSNATSYTWTLPPGATGSSTSNSISVNYGANAVSGQIKVQASNNCGVSNLSSLPITVNSVPNAPSAITGTTNVCPGQNGVTYTVPTITGATSYFWTLPSGAIGTSTTNSISVNYSSTAVAGNISVQGNNSCGLGPISSFAIQLLCSPNISYNSQNIYTTGSAINPLAPTNTGGPVSGNYSITPNLPYGLTFDPVTGTISGIPTTAKPTTSYTVTTTNNAGNNTSTFIISVNNLLSPNINYNSPQVYTVGTTINPLIPNNSGGTIPSNSSSLVTTFAGNGLSGSTDGIGYEASFKSPWGLAIDGFGNIYTADVNNNKIRKITPSGSVSTFAGSGIQGATDGVGTTASFYFPNSVAVDTNGNLYVADKYNHKVRKITPAGLVSTLAGNGSQGSSDGEGTIASFKFPHGVAVDTNGNVYVSDTYNHKIRKISPTGLVSTLAGNGAQGSIDGLGTISSFKFPYGLGVDLDGNVYVADRMNHKIRKITSTGVVSTLAGNSGLIGSSDGSTNVASFSYPDEVVVDGTGNMYVAEQGNYKIRKITSAGLVSSFAGSGNEGTTDGVGSTAGFNYPCGVVVDVAGNVFVADVLNNKIRKISIIGYKISPPLPMGLNFDSITGIISGTPTIATPATTYTVTGYNFSGSSSTTIVISTSTLGSNDFLKNSIKLFPNPTHSNLNLSINDGTIIDKITIVDITGKVVLVQTENLSIINVEKLAKGVYILTAYAGDKKYREKFIKE